MHPLLHQRLPAPPFASAAHLRTSSEPSFRALPRWITGAIWLCLASAALGNVGPPRELNYGGDANFPPYEFIDARGEPAGFNIDLVRTIARDQGLVVHFRLGPWPEIRQAFRRGDVDVAAMYRSRQRATEMDFAIPHELVYHEMYIRRGATPLRGLDDLQGRQVAVQEGTHAHDALVERGLAGSLVLVVSEPDALRSVAEGLAEVAVVTQTVGRPFQTRAALGTQIAVTGAPVLLSEYAFVTQPGRRAVVALLNDGLVAIKTSGDYARLYERWLRPGDGAVRWVRWLLAGLGATAALVVWFVIWNRVLRQRVAQQTLALRREFEERERAQLALAENERKLRQAQKMETVGRLAGGIAHDFNNILTIILNYGYFLRADLTAAQQPTGSADAILAAAERGARLTRHLLAFSRETPVETAPHDLAEIVRDILAMVQRLVGEQVQIETKLPSEPVVADVDRMALEQALLNLAANARDAMQHHGRLTLAVAHRLLPAGNPLQLPVGDYATITVSDTGSGMTAQTLARLGEPFFTTKAPGKGTGLGLASVYATVAKHGGKVGVHSELGVGTTFELLLPPTLPTAPAGCVVARPMAAHRGSGQRVLLVEDDEALRRAAQLALDRSGYEVIEARDGEHALDLVDRGAEFHLVVTDVVMPRSSGPQLVAQLRRRRAKVLVLYMSGYVHKETALDLHAPDTAFLAKPYTSDQLTEAVHLLLSRGFGTRNNIARLPAPDEAAR